MIKTTACRCLRATVLLGSIVLARGSCAYAIGLPEQANATPPPPGIIFVGDETAAGDTLDSLDDLAVAERLTLRFRGYPELTGDYRIGPDHMISVPVVGRVLVTGLNLGKLEKALSVKLNQITQKEAFVTAEIATYRPVFITGSVRNPGSVEWRPNLTVLQAISLSGGMAAELVPGAGLSPASNPVALQKAVGERKNNLAVIARLRAERDGSASIAIPPDLVGLAGQSEAKRLIAQESEILTQSRETVTAKLNSLQQAIEVALTEQASLRDQMAKLNSQLQMRAEYMNKVKDMYSKGYVTAERSLEAEIRMNDLEEKITNIKVGLARSAGTIAELKFRSIGLKRDREERIAGELAKLERDSTQLQTEIGASKQAAQGPPQESSEREVEKGKQMLRIVRQQAGGSVTMAADAGTLMRPGDVLVVSGP